MGDSMSGVILSGDTSGTVSLQVPAVAGTNTITVPAATGTLALTGAAVTGSQLPAGTVLQAVSAYKTDTQTVSSGAPTFVDISGLSVTITPRSSSSKFLCIFSVVMGSGADLAHGYVRLNRNGTAIGVADTAGSRTSASAGVANTSQGGQVLTATNSYLDSPSTASAITYKLTVTTNNVNPTYINRSSRDNDGTYYDGRSTSSLTVLEIAG